MNNYSHDPWTFQGTTFLQMQIPQWCHVAHDDAKWYRLGTCVGNIFSLMFAGSLWAPAHQRSHHGCAVVPSGFAGQPTRGYHSWSLGFGHFDTVTISQYGSRVLCIWWLKATRVTPYTARVVHPDHGYFYQMKMMPIQQMTYCRRRRVKDKVRLNFLRETRVEPGTTCEANKNKKRKDKTYHHRAQSYFKFHIPSE